MITQTLTLFDSTKKAIEGTATFRENASYSWSWLVEHAIQQNTLIEQINSTLTSMNSLAQATQQNAEIASNKADEATQARNQTLLVKEAVLSATAVLQNGTINDSTLGLDKVYSNQKINSLLDALDLSNIAETITLKHFTQTLLTKLNGIAENANNYSHPSTHNASMINESPEKRFVSDTEKASWNNKQDALTLKTVNNTSLLGTGDISVGVPTGTVIALVGLNAPIGYIKGNGALLSRIAFADLWAYAQTSGALVSDAEWSNSRQGCFSTGDGNTTFRTPDLRAHFLRGFDDGRGIDINRVFGSAQADELKSHTHTFYGSFYSSGLGGGGSPVIYSGGNSSTYETGGTETRPKNIALLYCIKY